MRIGYGKRPTPPVNHRTISFVAAGLVEGKNQKNNSSSADVPMGSKPAYDSPISKSRPGKLVPFTAYSKLHQSTVIWEYVLSGVVRVVLAFRNLDSVARLVEYCFSAAAASASRALCCHLFCCLFILSPYVPGLWVAEASPANASIPAMFVQRILVT